MESSSDKINDAVIAQSFYNPLTHYSNRNCRISVLHVKKTYKELKSKPLPKAFKARLDGPSINWEVFKRLSLAETYIDKHTKDCMIFSFEDRTPENAGRRMFLVAHPQQMWQRHQDRLPHLRCTYEVIRENSACKLYFDLEFNKMDNPKNDGNKMTKIFIQCVIAVMFEAYNIHLRTSHFLWLDASTDKKFSSHLIVQIPDHAFQNNVFAGSFVTFLLSQIMSRITKNTDSCHLWPSNEELKSLLIVKADETLIFCDSCVYTKNRNFRLYLSTKYGKNAPLLLSQYNEYIPNDISLKNLDEAIFYDSLITYFRKNTKNLKLLSEPQQNLVKSIPLSRNLTNTKVESNNISENGLSLFPEIDNFILTQIKDFNAVGFIRKWVYLKREELLVYEIGNYRYCSNIGRHHKSNNIMMIVDMIKKHFYQKCHDPECRSKNYKSIPKPLPTSVSSIYTFSDDFFDSNCFTQLEKKSTEVENLNNSDEEDGLNNANLMKIDDTFFEESFPFTQFPSTSKGENCLKDDTINKLEIRKSASFDDNETVLEDNYFDNICLEELELNNNEEKKDDRKANCSIPPAEQLNSNILQEKKNSSSDSITAEDEIMMVETVAILEQSFENQDMFSEDSMF